MTELLVSTLEGEPPGRLIVAVLGIVVGTEARPINPFLDGVKQLTPESQRDYPVKLAYARMLAVSAMTRNAKTLGANAVLGVRFDHRPLSASWIELCAYGTAVTLARLDVPRQRRSVDDQAYDSGAGV